jgi:hypothetical protein
VISAESTVARVLSCALNGNVQVATSRIYVSAFMETSISRWQLRGRDQGATQEVAAKYVKRRRPWTVVSLRGVRDEPRPPEGVDPLSEALLPVAVNEGMDGSVPKPIGGDPTNRAVVGEERIGLFLGEDSLGVQACASTPYYSACRCGLDEGRASTAAAQQQRGSRVDNQ